MAPKRMQIQIRNSRLPVDFGFDSSALSRSVDSYFVCNHPESLDCSSDFDGRPHTNDNLVLWLGNLPAKYLDAMFMSDYDEFTRSAAKKPCRTRGDFD